MNSEWSKITRRRPRPGGEDEEEKVRWHSPVIVDQQDGYIIVTAAFRVGDLCETPNRLLGYIELKNINKKVKQLIKETLNNKNDA